MIPTGWLAATMTDVKTVVVLVSTELDGSSGHESRMGLLHAFTGCLSYSRSPDC